MKIICIGKELFGDVVNDTDPRFNSSRYRAFKNICNISRKKN